MTSPSLETEDTRATRPRSRWRVLGILLLLALLAPAPWLARRGASKLAFFHLRKVVVEGTKYLSPDTVVARLRVDTLHSVFDDVPPLEMRIRVLPQVADVEIQRRLPGTLVVRIRENLPVAFVPGAHGLEPVDSAGVTLPIDPALHVLDLPVCAQRDRALIALVGNVRAANVVLYQRISEASRDASGDVLLLLSSARAPQKSETQLRRSATGDSASSTGAEAASTLRVRVPMGVSAARLTDIFPVEFDLRRRGARVAELDLRYRDQVIARLQ